MWAAPSEEVLTTGVAAAIPDVHRPNTLEVIRTLLAKKDSVESSFPIRQSLWNIVLRVDGELVGSRIVGTDE